MNSMSQRTEKMQHAYIGLTIHALHLSTPSSSKSHSPFIMEFISQEHRGLLIHTSNSVQSTLLINQVFAKLLGLLRIFILMLVLGIEAIVFLKNENPIFYLFLLLFCLLVFCLPFKRCHSKSCPVFLVDFSCFKPPEQCKISFSTFIEHASMFGSFNSETIAFMDKIISSSGLSDETYLPPALLCLPPKPHHEESLQEAQMVFFPVIEELFAKTKLSPCNIDILILNCSGFCPSPSLCSIVINKFKMREDIKSYNLSGMGCSASALGIDLAHNLLRVHKNSYALVLSTEILSTGWYSGNERPKLLLNCLFRSGSAAVLLTNKREAKDFSKYSLISTLRTQTAYDDKAYLSVIREEDTEGILGVTLRRDLLQVVRDILRLHIFVLGFSVLPFSEKLRYGAHRCCGIFIKSKEIHVPNFRKVIHHFCLPASGKAVIRDIGKGLKLGERDIEPALMTLHRFGNQSSSSLWYQVSYLEAKRRVRKGHKVCQVGMGSGLKCITVVWECLRSMEEEGNSRRGPWDDCIARYPVLGD